jgi:hypothetical protein
MKAGGGQDQDRVAGAWRMLRLASLAGVVLVGVVWTPGVTADTALPAPTPADVAATHAYLVAEYTFDRTALANLGASNAAFTTAAAGLEVECPGVLAGLARSNDAAPASGMLQTPNKKELIQVFDLDGELLLTLIRSWLQTDRPAASTFARTLRSLRFSDPQLARAARNEIRKLEHDFDSPLPDICADMNAWATSGYQNLSPATTEFVNAEERAGPTMSLLEASVRTLVASWESPPDRMLAKGIKRLSDKLLRALEALSPISEHLVTVLGLEGLGKLTVQRPRSDVVIGHGTTSAGTKFVASVEPPPKLDDCKPGLTITEAEGPLTVSSGGSRCGSASSDQTVVCDDGLLKIEAAVLPETRHVRLLLSDGRSITSRVLLLPAGVNGGPAGFYYQAVRGPMPIPVSLTELDAQGRKLRVLKLSPVRACKPQPED